MELRKARLALLHVLHPLAVGHLVISVVHFSFQHNSESSEKFFVFGGTSITFIFTVIQILLKLRILPCGKGPPILLNNVKKNPYISELYLFLLFDLSKGSMGIQLF